MTSEKRLLRSRKALIGGVCAGVADYFNVDPVIVRIIMVVFTLASGGLLGIAYILLWIVLPLEPKEEAPLDVHPQSVHSETYGTFEFGGTPRKTESGAQNAPNPAQAAGWRYAHPPYASAAHVPPEPPAGASRASAAAPADASRSYAPPASHSHEGWMHAAPQQQPPAKSSRSGVKAALFAGSFLLFFGMSAMVASMVEGVVWWQYWPLIFVILGIVGMVVPGEEGHRMRQFVDSLITFSAGVVLVLMSLDVIGWRSIEFMLVGLWPPLLIMVGLLLLGGALKSPLLTLLAGLCFVAFCVVGLLWYSVPGATEELVFSAPYGREYRFDMQPWENIGLNESVVISITE